MSGGTARASRYSSGWGNESAKDAVNRIAPNSKPIVTDTGKIIYNNPNTGKQVIFDIEGNYFRIENTTLHGKRVYSDINGNTILNNRIIDGRQVGISQGEYNQMTHFNNMDIDFPYDR